MQKFSFTYLIYLVRMLNGKHRDLETIGSECVYITAAEGENEKRSREVKTIHVSYSFLHLCFSSPFLLFSFSCCLCLTLGTSYAMLDIYSVSA